MGWIKSSSQIFLQAEFGFEIKVADLVNIRSRMNAICRNFRNVWRPVSPSKIGFDAKLITKFIRKSNASTHARKWMFVCIKRMISARSVIAFYYLIKSSNRVCNGIQIIIPVISHIITQASWNLQLIHSFLQINERADIELPVRWDNKLSTFVHIIVLVHAVHSGCYTKTVYLFKIIFSIVSVGI